jgi:uncharacterized integral membrane protein
MSQEGQSQPSSGSHWGQTGSSQQPSGRPPGSDVSRVQQDQLKALERARQARVVKILVALAILVILIIFVIANSSPVKVNFVVLTRHPRLIWVMIACAVLGGIVGYLIGRPGRQVGRPGRKGEPQRR